MPNNNNLFDFMRLFAALMVIYSHSFALYGKKIPAPLAGQSYGSLAVYIFFTISGFLICKSWSNDPNLKRYLIRRGLRIFPGLISAVIFTALVVGSLATTLPILAYITNNLTWEYIANNILMISSQHELPGVFENNPFANAANASLWTLRYEILMYLLLSIIGFIANEKKLKWLCLIVLLFFSASWIFNELKFAHSNLFTNYLKWLEVNYRVSFEWNSMTSLGVFFFAGCCFYLFNLESKSHYTTVIAAILCIIIYITSHNEFLVMLLLWIALPLITLQIGCKSFVKFNKNNISYGAYIYAFPIQQTFSQIAIQYNINWAITFVFSTAITLILAIISWKYIEHPFMNIKTKLTMR